MPMTVLNLDVHFRSGDSEVLLANKHTVRPLRYPQPVIQPRRGK
jgi:hypothetical protein